MRTDCRRWKLQCWKWHWRDKVNGEVLCGTDKNGENYTRTSAGEMAGGSADSTGNISGVCRCTDSNNGW